MAWPWRSSRWPSALAPGARAASARPGDLLLFVPAVLVAEQPRRSRSRRRGDDRRPCCLAFAFLLDLPLGKTDLVYVRHVRRHRHRHGLARRPAAPGAAAGGRNAPRTCCAREAHLQSILDTVPDAMVVIDEQRRSSSRSAPRPSGCSATRAAEVIGQNVKMLMPSPYRENHDDYLDRYLHDRRAAHHRHRPRRRRRAQGRLDLPDGARRSARCAPATSAIFTGFIRDLTERQETEARLQELQSELVHISRLTAMGEMASTLAHELNQPLSAIANYLEGLAPPASTAMPTTPPRKIRDAIDKAGEQALRAGQIIRRLRDFVARGESERSVENLQQADRGGERAGPGRRQGARRPGALHASIRASTSCSPTRSRSSRSSST